MRNYCEDGKCPSRPFDAAEACYCYEEEGSPALRVVHEGETVIAPATTAPETVIVVLDEDSGNPVEVVTKVSDIPAWRLPCRAAVYALVDTGKVETRTEFVTDEQGAL